MNQIFTIDVLKKLSDRKQVKDSKEYEEIVDASRFIENEIETFRAERNQIKLNLKIKLVGLDLGTKAALINESLQHFDARLESDYHLILKKLKGLIYSFLNSSQKSKIKSETTAKAVSVPFTVKQNELIEDDDGVEKNDFKNFQGTMIFENNKNQSSEIVKRERKKCNMTTSKTAINRSYQTEQTSHTNKPIENLMDVKIERVEKKIINVQPQPQPPPVASPQPLLINTENSNNPIKIDWSTIGYYTNGKPHKNPLVPSMNLLNEKAKIIQVELNDAEKYVYWKEILSILLEQYNCMQIGELGINKVNEIETIRELIKLQQKIDSFIIAYQTLPYITIIELEKCLCSFLHVSCFTELYVGPLIKNNLVRKLFDLPCLNYEQGDTYGTSSSLTDIKIMNMSYLELFKNLKYFLDEDKSNWYNRDLRLENFETFLKNKFIHNEVNEKLGVKIFHFYSMLSALKNARRLHFDTTRVVNDQINEELNKMLEQEKLWLKKRFEEKLNELNDGFVSTQLMNSLDARCRILNMNATDIICDIVAIFEMNSTSTRSSKLRQSMIADFLKKSKQNQYLKYILQIGFCLTNDAEFSNTLNNLKTNYPADFNQLILNIFGSLMTKLNEKQLKSFFNKFLGKHNLKICNINDGKANRESSTSDDDDDDDDNYTEVENVKTLKNKTNKIDIITRSEVLEVLNVELMQHKLHRFTNSDLLKLEERLLSKYGFKDFSQFNFNCTFLQFIFQNENLFEKFGSILNTMNTGSTGNAVSNIDVLLYSKQIYRNFLRESSKNENEMVAILENAVCSYYNVRNVKDLGLGDGAYLLNQMKSMFKEDAEEGEIVMDTIIYENSILDMDYLCKSEIECDLDVEREMLIEKILKCPYLEDLYEYTQWDLVYAKLFGNDFKEFIECLNKQCRIYNDEQIVVRLLEVKPKCLLKLKMDASIEQVKSAIESLDYINVAAYLVSLIAIKYRSFHLAPKCLIANQIQSSFIICFSKFDESTFYTFIVKLLFRMPISFTSNCLFQFFIEPLVKIEGSSFIVKTKIFKNTIELQNKSIVERIIHLGRLCGISEWSSNVPSENNVMIAIEKPDIIKIDTSNKEANTEDLTPSVQVVSIKSSQPIQQPESSNMDEQAQIESIRRLKYGIGVDLNDAGNVLANSLKGVIGRSLDRLSNELYNKDIHFVLELIQNADDNCYENLNEDSITPAAPTLIFLIEPNAKITLFNNEIGFRKENIEAICDVGTSTKGKHQHGYIGRKGIGFKSVFTVTDEPEIHSNGYHIKFNTKTGPIGYILPYWIDNEDIVKAENFKKFLLNNLFENEENMKLNTSICLPLKPESEMEKHKSRCLTSSFKDIQPSLLLFLNRLRNIFIITKKDESTFEKRHYKRVDLNESVIQISHENKIDKWLIVREVIKIPDSIKPNEEVESTDLCLAFPIYPNLNETSESYYDTTSLNKMDVFAYLPLRSFGFSFIIQADFEVPASRQDITQDNEWNQWICKHIPKLFVDALKKFQNYDEYTDKITALIAYLKYVPLETEILGFFQHVASEILYLLRNEAIFPVIEGDEVTWKKPYECVILKDNFIREVLTSGMLKTHLSRYYLHPQLVNTNQVNKKLLHILGVHTLDLRNILEILKQIFKESLDLIDVKYMANWLVVLQRAISMYSFQEESELLEQAKRLKFIPLKNGEIISLYSNVVFFPASDKKHESSSLFGLIDDLNVIDLDLLLCLNDDVKNSQILILLKKLGVKDMCVQDVIDHHIMQNLENTASTTLLVNYTVFLHECWRRNKNCVDTSKLKATMSVKTNKGVLKLNDEENTVYLTETYESRCSLDKMFPEYNWCLVDDIYFNNTRESSFKHVKQSWREFFKTLGIHDTLNLTRKPVVLTYNELCDKLPEYVQQLPKINEKESFIFEDYICQAFEFYVNNTDNEKIAVNLRKVFVNFLKIFEDNWNNDCKFERFKYLNVTVSGKVLKENLCDTTFFRNLKTTKWLFGKYTEHALMTESYTVRTIEHIKVYEPHELYVLNDTLFQYYGFKVPYTLDTSNVDKNKTFYKDIGLKIDFSFPEFLNDFQLWCSNEKMFFSLNQMKCIYAQIANYLNNPFDLGMTQKCNQLIQNNAIIFVPSTKATTKSFDEIRCGVLYRSNSVQWCDKTRLFDKYKPEFKPVFLNFSYGEYKNEFFKQIFLNNLVFLENPDNLDYLRLIEHIGTLAVTDSNIEIETVLSDVFRIYEVLTENTFLFKEDLCSRDIDISVKHNLLRIIQDKKIFPCYNNMWCALNESPILVDNSELAQHFLNKLKLIRHIKTTIAAVAVGGGNEATANPMCDIGDMSEKARIFLEDICELKLFSNVVKQDYDNLTTSLKFSPNVQNLCRKYLPFIQAYIYSKENFKTIYDECKRDDVVEHLKLFKCFSVRDLEAVYHYIYDESIRVALSYKHSCIKNNKESYWQYFVRLDVLDDDKEILKGFLKFFFTSNTTNTTKLEKDLSKFVLLMYRLLANDGVLSKKDKVDIENDYEINLTLPSSEILWTIEEAVEVTPAVVKNEENKQKFNFVQQNRVPLSVLSSISRNQQPTPATGEILNTPFVTVNLNKMENFNASQLNNKTNEPKHIDLLIHNQNLNKPQFISQESQLNVTDVTTTTIVNHEGFSKVNVNDENKSKAPFEHDSASCSKIAAEQLLYDNNSLSVDDELNQLSVNSSDDKQYLSKIGRWGELWIYKMLKQKYSTQIQSEYGSVSVIWINENGETGEPYDIKITFFNSDNSIIVNEVYIEVKSTIHSNKECFPVSIKELLFAEKYQKNYFIYRLYNAGTVNKQNVFYKIIDNLPSQLIQHSIDLLMII